MKYDQNSGMARPSKRPKLALKAEGKYEDGVQILGVNEHHISLRNKLAGKDFPNINPMPLIRDLNELPPQLALQLHQDNT